MNNQRDLERRLKNLEQTPLDHRLSDRHCILVAILAQSDAIFTPVRDFDKNLPANAWSARTDYLDFGVPYAAPDKSDAGRKAKQRALESLAEEKAITIARPHKRKAVYVKLSEQTEAEIRSLCGLPSLAAALEMMQDLARLAADPELLKRRPEGWVDEWALTAPDESVEAASLVEELFLPALVRGWVESGATVRRNARYKLTRAGRERLSSLTPEDLVHPEPDGDFDEGLWRVYLHVRQERLAELRTAESDNPQEIGLIPLPVRV